MESICIRLDSALAEQIEKDMKEFKYSTKTEFIREAIRDKLNENRKERAMSALLSARGILKGQGRAKTDEEWRRLKEEAGDEFFKQFEEKTNQK